MRDGIPYDDTEKPTEGLAEEIDRKVKADMIAEARAGDDPKLMQELAEAMRQVVADVATMLPGHIIHKIARQLRADHPHLAARVRHAHKFSDQQFDAFIGAAIYLDLEVVDGLNDLVHKNGHMGSVIQQKVEAAGKAMSDPATRAAQATLAQQMGLDDTDDGPRIILPDTPPRSLN